MCGILGVIEQGHRAGTSLSRFNGALALMMHRGPNNQRSLNVDAGVLLGHARLSILDVSDASSQPFEILNRYVLVYNGEIFNFENLRRQLRTRGAVFQTSGDTEVVAWAYHFWGDRCVDHFNGMWAFAVYDRRERSLFLSRDRFGEKPLYIASVGETFLFSSEIKSMIALYPELARPKISSIVNFCRTSVGAQHEQTWFENVFRVPPATNVRLTTSGVTSARYWNYPEDVSTRVGKEDAIAEYRDIFMDSVRIRLRSDVPLGLTLSSGLDSSSIACVMRAAAGKSLHAFTAGFNPRQFRKSEYASYAADSMLIDEASIAQQLCSDIGLESNIVRVDYTSLVSKLRRIVWHLEAGNSSPAVIPLMQVLAAAKERVTVVLEGQGADELMAGYSSAVLFPAVADALRNGLVNDAVAHLQGFRKSHSLLYAAKIGLRLLGNNHQSINRLYQRISGIESVLHRSVRKVPTMLDWPLNGDSPRLYQRGSLSRTLRRQHTGGLVNLLHYGDALSMANSVESRMPFMDYRLIEYCWRLPSTLKFNSGVGKWIHREAMKGVVPDYILSAKRKLGFNTPIAAQFDGDGGSDEDPISVLLSPEVVRRGVFDSAGLSRLIERHRSGAADFGNLLFRLTLVELWFREFIDRDWSRGV